MPDLARFASKAALSRGRIVSEQPSPTRTEFQRDRDRIVHSTAFRRLAHKTQVFVPLGSDHFRTRLTHTIEVAQIARSLSRGLRVDDDLAEALALAHDLGHTPFGHVGEDALDALMRGHGGFDHNAQALRLLTRLERRYARFDGLNLTWETLEGLVKHNGPLRTPDGAPTARYRARGIPKPILDFDAECRSSIGALDLASHASLEAQIAAIADDIAYNSHDMDDGLRAGLFEFDDLRQAAPFVDELLSEIEATYGALERTRVIHELGRRVITRFVEDALDETGRRIAETGVASVADVRRCGRTLVSFSPALAEADRSIKTFLFRAMYRHPDVMRVRAKATEIVERLFPLFLETPSAMPLEWTALYRGARDDASRARVVADYIAGMTDRYALGEYRRLVDASMDLI
ncbi:MAG: deoxyguanosinetriphosphate triphosphohydrolase [Hyphomicrobiales bacterium]|nr:deoxyguanosinetriphosphate triphosphohydrolase [Hyphomicrobiales bacterium]